MVTGVLINDHKIGPSNQNCYEKKIPKSTTVPGISLGMHPANERRRYIVTTSLIGWAHT